MYNTCISLAALCIQPKQNILILVENNKKKNTYRAIKNKI